MWNTLNVSNCFLAACTYSLWFQHMLDLSSDGNEVADVFVGMESLIAQVVLPAFRHRQLFNVHYVTTSPVSWTERKTSCTVKPDTHPRNHDTPSGLSKCEWWKQYDLHTWYIFQIVQCILSLKSVSIHHWECFVLWKMYSFSTSPRVLCPLKVYYFYTSLSSLSLVNCIVYIHHQESFVKCIVYAHHLEYFVLCLPFVKCIVYIHHQEYFIIESALFLLYSCMPVQVNLNRDSLISSNCSWIKLNNGITLVRDSRITGGLARVKQTWSGILLVIGQSSVKFMDAIRWSVC